MARVDYDSGHWWVSSRPLRLGSGLGSFLITDCRSQWPEWTRDTSKGRGGGEAAKSFIWQPRQLRYGLISGNTAPHSSPSSSFSSLPSSSRHLLTLSPPPFLSPPPLLPYPSCALRPSGRLILLNFLPLKPTRLLCFLPKKKILSIGFLLNLQVDDNVLQAFSLIAETKLLRSIFQENSETYRPAPPFPVTAGEKGWVAPSSL